MMNEYELKVYEEILNWKRKITRRSGMMTRMSKKMQKKINDWIPEKINQAAAESIKAMVKVTLSGSQITSSKPKVRGLSLEERDHLVRKKISAYQKTAFVEGAGTGAGGILLGFADFPLLLMIKMKFLFETAAIYGYDTRDFSERLFILHIFLLAFSSGTIRKETLETIEDWELRRSELEDIDWFKLQQEYRDCIDLSKLLQIVPGIGALIGAYANQSLLKQLGETAMNAYRLRVLKTAPQLF